MSSGLLDGVAARATPLLSRATQLASKIPFQLSTGSITVLRQPWYRQTIWWGFVVHMPKGKMMKLMLCICQKVK